MKKMLLILSITCLLFSCGNENSVNYNGFIVYEKNWDELEYFYCSGQRCALLNDTMEVSDVYGGSNYDVYNCAFNKGYTDYKGGDIRIMYDKLSNEIYWTKSPWDNINPWNVGKASFIEDRLAVYLPQYQTIRYLYKKGEIDTNKITTFDK